LTCPFCNSERDKTEEEHVEDLMKRAEANDPAAIYAYITREEGLCSRIRRSQWNCTLGQQS
jgi:hypothetical protein